MIKVVYTYQTPTKYLDELMAKFQQSAAPQFDSQPTNTKIEMFRHDIAEETVIVLDIYYHSFEDWQSRRSFEENNPEWQKIWFDKNSKHTEISVEWFECL